MSVWIDDKQVGRPASGQGGDGPVNAGPPLVEVFKSGAATVVVDDEGTIAVIGELDIAAGDAMHKALAAVGERPRLRIDMRDVRFVDSAGLRSLLQCIEAGHAVTLVGAPASLRRLLEITATADLFDDESPAARPE